MIVGIVGDVTISRVSFMSLSGKGGMRVSVVSSSKYVVLTLLVVWAISGLRRLNGASIDKVSAILTLEFVCGAWVILMLA